jgi:hypothetical protein
VVFGNHLPFDLVLKFLDKFFRKALVLLNPAPMYTVFENHDRDFWKVLVT